MTILQIVCLVAFLLVNGLIIKNISFEQFRADSRRQHIVFGAAASVFALWLFRAGIYPGLDVHFLWLPALALILGFRFAILAGTLALVGTTIIGHDDWSMLGVNGLLGIVAPIALTYVIFMISFHRIPRNLFVYIFVCAFFPGAAMIALKMGLLGGYYFIDSIYAWDVIKDNYLILIPLLLFPEGMLNGMTITLLTIYKPEWVYTFHDKFYLDNK
ncbi:energy-coupling factor ABC transporter permease [Alteromonas sp. ASW11-130]|uniref:energy-coupling factor ABC transporter permease n=1 Tax=Alteromonas sp. ASW11-130 TaxID=3015775 RepID=UPI0022429D26|nr:energy-coupling factor ABC transporter permease [Alteromonas sp. ASW11-130]MCW8090611.1 energy-coupling factor ABC transporter permease [Alteromonas sp. ASW11-130]